MTNNPTPNVSDALWAIEARALELWGHDSQSGEQSYHGPDWTEISEKKRDALRVKAMRELRSEAALASQPQDAPANAELVEELEAAYPDGSSVGARLDAEMFASILTALRSTPQGEGAGDAGWQPIETAPRDGKVLLCWPDGKVAVGWFDDQRHHKNPKPRWTPHHMGARYEQQNQPTDWQPIPKAPLYAGRTA